AGISKGLKHSFHIADIDLWFGDSQPDLRGSRFCARHPAVRLKENSCGYFPVKSGFADTFHSLIVQTDCVRVVFPADIRCDGGFKAMLTELLEHSSTKLRVVQGCGAKSDQWVAMAAFESCLIGVRNPQGQKPQDSAGLLKSR